MSMPSRMPCAQCGATVVPEDADAHTCDPPRRVEFQMAALGSRIAAFDTDLRDYLAGTQGRFEVWMARRDVRRSA